MRFRYISLFAVTAMLLMALAGCGPNVSGPESGGPSQDESALPTIAPTPTVFVLATPEPGAEATEAPAGPASGESGYAVGQAMPDFSVPLVGGGTFTLSKNLGRPVFINLYATWCPPCVGEMPEIDQLCAELGSEVNFIAIDIGEDEATAQAFADSNGLAMPLAYSEDGVPLPGYKIKFIPQTFVLKADGTIAAYFGGSSDYDGFKAAIEEAMAQ